MLGPLLIVYRGFLVIFSVLQKKKIVRVKKKKNILLNVNLKNDVKQKRYTRVILLDADKISTRKKSKLRVWRSYRKKIA